MNRGTEIVLALAKLQGAREVLELITAGGGDQAAGRKALLLAYLLTPEAIGTQGDLARRLGVSEGRCSQMLKPLRRHLLSNSPPGLTARLKMNDREPIQNRHAGSHRR